MTSVADQTTPSQTIFHHWFIRLTHWIGAAAIICMIFSGWAIYNASPILPFAFPGWATLGGWLAGGIAWHLTAMWVLMIDGLAYLVWGLLSGHFRRDFLPLSARGFARDVAAAFRLQLAHGGGRYNAVQRALYAAVVLGITLAVLTGLAIWKPVQLGWLTWCFGGYDIARRIHFAMMACIVLFLIIHLTLVAIVPSTLTGMILGAQKGRRV